MYPETPVSEWKALDEKHAVKDTHGKHPSLMLCLYSFGSQSPDIVYLHAVLRKSFHHPPLFVLLLKAPPVHFTTTVYDAIGLCQVSADL